ncbi:AGAP003280-PA-like protein [Anopheles sinensis]|uniref:AGAP003280-PA-like protein n=1 Tax=Anopheles sinensis TaxID=74873 RepID=A0A084W3C7_ANOSI|nr:AGAP003280-PA-like protein [Anopheles sinensis]
MEDNIISMFMDVKLDIRERKLEFSHMKSWSRYFVRVEAVKCFPCYMRISFFTSPTDLTTDLIVRINIPGLTVQMATSRTKQHSYGLFWKNNRKRCCAYFALETQLLCERHLRWMKKSIRNLELYRQEMMQLRRASRTPLYEIRQEMQPIDPVHGPVGSPANVVWDDMGIYQNLDNTQNIMGLQDILGPLPNVPPAMERADGNGSVNCSRRVSGMSGIYEEIRDHPRLSRVSIASGIYEEMKLVVDGKDTPTANPPQADENASDSPPPPLPPRPRSNTNEDFDLQRSFTTPEVDLMKKKRHWLRLDTMFGRRRTTSTESQGSGTSKKRCSSSKNSKKLRSSEERMAAEKDASEVVIHRGKVSRLRLAENKRNSFSSPDLSRLKIDDTQQHEPGVERMCDESFENLSEGDGSCTSEFYAPNHDIDFIEEDFASSEFINMSTTSSLGAGVNSGKFERRQEEEELDPLRDFRRLNISERIFEGFNRSMNCSTVNLVGAGCNASTIEETTEPDPSPARVPPAPLSDADMVGYLEMGPAGTGFNRQKLDEVIYRNQPVGASCGAAVDLGPKVIEESIYMSMDGTGKLPEPIRSSSTSSSSSSSSGVSSASDHSTLTEGSTKHRNSVDDKIPSYYPNEDFVRTPPSRRSPPDGKRSPGQARDKIVTPIATTLPRTIKSVQRAPADSTTAIQDRIHATFRTPKATSNRRPNPRNLLQLPEPTATESVAPESSGSLEPSPKLYQKYATLARITSPSKYSPRAKPEDGSSAEFGPVPAITTTPVTSSRRFGSLPRFGKIDLSPLRMKINSVLQRHNSGNV